MTITVVNVKHDKRPEVIYIGRWMPRRAGSPLGNPFKANKYPDAIDRYRRWLWEQLASDTPQRREMNRLVELHRAGRDLLLGCWCAPEPCHGDVVKAAIEWMAGPVTQKQPEQQPASLVGARVCFTNLYGAKHYGVITAIEETGRMVQVDWENPTERNWVYAPGRSERKESVKFEVVEA